MAVYKEEKTGTWRVIYRYTDMYNIPNTDKSIVIDYNDDVKVNRVRLFDLNKWVDYEN